jgi:hypothetical protein
MSLEELASKYIDTADYVLKRMQVVENPIGLSTGGIGKVIEHAKAYLDDAKYYRDKRGFEVSLTSVAYCEGLLDALKMLGAVKFEWPAKPQPQKEK